MKLKFQVRVHILLSLFAMSISSLCHGLTIDFENLADYEPVANSFSTSGVVMSGAYGAVAFGTAGGSLNDIDFPPTSGTTLITNSDIDGNLGRIEILLSLPYVYASAYFSYAESFPDNGITAPLTISAYSASDALLDQITISENLGSNGGSPTFGALGTLTSTDLIAKLVIEGETDSYFTLDDLTLAQPESNSVPEPAVWALMLAALPAWLRQRKFSI